MSMDIDCVVRGGTVVFPERGSAPATLLIREGRIVGIAAPGEDMPNALRVIDATGKHVFPGLIDAHLHFGFAEPLTEYATETASAAIGGISTVIAYFLTGNPYSEMFAGARRDVEARAHVDFGFHFSTASEQHLAEMETYVTQYGVNSFKYFMNFKGEEGRYMGLDGTDDGFLYDLMQEAARLRDVVLVIHPENIEIVKRVKTKFMAEGRATLKDWSLSKPDFTETESIVRAMVFARQFGAKIYIVHLSCKSGLDEIRFHRQRYDRVLVETCPQYLTHTMESDLGSIGKANPPLRTQDDIDALWAGIADGAIDVVASDHVPRKRATKEKGIWQASQGFPGTAMILPVLLSEGYHKRGLSLQRIAQVAGSKPAEIFGIDSRKGRIAVGADADLTIVDLDLERVVRAAELGSWSDYSLYDGWTLKGWPVLTMVRGLDVMRDGKIVGPQGHGRFLARPIA